MEIFRHWLEQVGSLCLLGSEDSLVCMLITKDSVVELERSHCMSQYMQSTSVPPIWPNLRSIEAISHSRPHVRAPCPICLFIKYLSTAGPFLHLKMLIEDLPSKIFGSTRMISLSLYKKSHPYLQFFYKMRKEPIEHHDQMCDEVYLRKWNRDPLSGSTYDEDCPQKHGRLVILLLT